MHNCSMTDHNAPKIPSRSFREFYVGQIWYNQRRYLVLSLRVETSEVISLPPLNSSRPVQLVFCNIPLETLEVCIGSQQKMCLSSGENNIKPVIIMQGINGNRNNSSNEAAHERDRKVNTLSVLVY